MKFYNIQAMRGVAALMVLLIHVMQHNYGIDAILYRFWWIGPAGVDIFFVISGFVVCYAAARASAGEETSLVSASKFSIKRLVRIYPLYWVVLACAWTVSDKVSLAPNYLPEYSVWRYLTLTIVQNNKVMVAWTLAYEMFFYVVLAAIIFIRPKSFYKAVGFWVVLQVAAIGISWSLFKSASLDYVFTSPVILEFTAGCGLAYVIDKGVKGGGFLSLIYGIILFSVGAYVNSGLAELAWSPGWRALLFTPGALLILYGLIDLERSGAWVMPAWLQRVGDSSYSIYMWHQLVVAILVAVVNRYGILNFVPGWLLIIFFAVISITVGFLSYRIIEKPSQNWIHGLIKRRDRKVLSEA